MNHLEAEAIKRTGGHAGAYELGRDDAGNLVVIIAGHSFIGSGRVSFGDKRLKVVDGIVVNVQ